MVALLPEQQEMAIEAEPDAFRPAAGAWGRKGSTLVRLDAGRTTGSSGRCGWPGRTGPPRTSERDSYDLSGEEVSAPAQSRDRRVDHGLVGPGVELSRIRRSAAAVAASAPWREPRRSRRARRRRSCPRPCGCGARPERRRRFSAWLTMPSASVRARSIIVAASASACGGLGLIFGAQRLGLGAQLRGLVELLADAGDLLVERLADRGRHPLPDHQREHGEHRQRDPAGGVEAAGGRLGMAAAMILGGAVSSS